MNKLAVGFVLALVSATVAAETKIGIVNLREVVAKSPQREAINEKLKAEFKDRIDALKKMEVEIKAMDDKAKKDAPTMTEQQRVDAGRNIQSKYSDYQLKQKALQEDSQRRESEEMRSLIGKVRQTVQAVAGKEGVQLVLSEEAVLFSQAQFDLTEKVVQALGTPAK